MKQEQEKLTFSREVAKYSMMCFITKQYSKAGYIKW